MDQPVRVRGKTYNPGKYTPPIDLPDADVVCLDISIGDRDILYVWVYSDGFAQVMRPEGTQLTATNYGAVVSFEEEAPCTK